MQNLPPNKRYPGTGSSRPAQQSGSNPNPPRPAPGQQTSRKAPTLNVQHSYVQYKDVQYKNVQYNNVQRNNVQYNNAQHNHVQYRNPQNPQARNPQLQKQQYPPTGYVRPVGQRVTKNVRVPAVNTLKAGGPRLEVPPNLRPGSAEERQRRLRAEMQAKAQKKQAVRDYLLGLCSGLIVFGIAAIFVCRALIDMFVL